MIKLDTNGLFPAIVQDIKTNEVLMLGYMSPGSLKKTLDGGQVWFYSRSRQELWKKGEISGNFIDFKEAFLDCDGDTLLLKVEPTGPVCHTGQQTCFFEKLDDNPEYQPYNTGSGILEELFSTIQDRKTEKPASSYTVQLLEAGIPRIAQKVIEEAGETALSASTGDIASVPEEVADLLYHTLVLLSATGIKPENVWDVLRKRRL